MSPSELAELQQRSKRVTAAAARARITITARLGEGDVPGASAALDRMATDLGETREKIYTYTPFYAAEVLLHQGDGTKAVELLEGARDTGWSTQRADILLTWAYLKSGRVNDARALYTPEQITRKFAASEITTVPADAAGLEAAVLLAVGLAHDFTAEHELAQRYYEMSLALDPDEPATMYCLAGRYAGEHRFDDAIQLLETALQGASGRIKRSIEIKLKNVRDAKKEFDRRNR